VPDGILWTAPTKPRTHSFGLVLLLLCGLGCRGDKAHAPAASPARASTAAAPAPVCIGDPVLRIAVQAGEYIHAVADQGARDVVLTLCDPQGRQLLRVDSLTAPGVSSWPAEEIHWVADAPGELWIELAVTSGPRGACGLRLVERRPATAADRRRVSAETDLARAHALRRPRKPEPCRAGIAPYESAQRGFADLGLPQRRAEALFGLGQLQRDCLHDERAALRAFTAAEPLSAGDPAFEAFVRQQRGTLLYNLGDLDDAITEDRQALALRHRLGDRAGEAEVAGNLGAALHRRGRYDEAAASFDSALALWKPGDDPGKRAQTLLNQGQLFRNLGKPDQARERFTAALALFHQAKNRSGEAVALHALGLLALDGGQPAEALKRLQEALELRLPGSHGRAVTLNTLGAVYRQLGRPDDARRSYAEALAIFRSLGDVQGQADALGNLGWWEAATGHAAAALDDFDHAYALFRRLADPPDVAWALAGKAWVLRRGGDLEQARKLMEEALAAVERHRFRQTSYTTRADFLATQEDRYDFLIDLLIQMHAAAAALEVNERSLARSLLDGLAASGARPDPGGAAPELRAQEKELEKEIDALAAREAGLAGLAEDADAAALRRPVEAELRSRWDELDRVRAELRSRDPRYAALTQPRPWKPIDVQRKLLDRDTLLLEYRLGEKRSFLWAVTPDSLACFVLPGRAEIEKVARPACLLSARSRSRTAELSAGPQLAQLSRLLLGPVARLLRGKRLLVVGDGILQSVPFAALPEDSEPLVARHEIVFLPSVSVLGELRREAAGRPPAPKTLWVLADPDFGGGIDPLPYSGQEAAAVLALAPAPKSLLQGREASRAAVLRGDLRDYRILHFATHGSFAADDPGGGRLVLAQLAPDGRPERNGFLYLADIYGLDLRADLVVLSACDSALGREVRGEGVMGMTRGFFYAGAERVLVSLWSVDDEVTVELMRRFYEGMLAGGLSPAAALRAAQDSIRRRERWRSPYYWAGFTLQGEWRGSRARGTSAGPARSAVPGIRR
jgi:CHAT domain-containing protein/tetratricopeptide (TPR) repeat protein